MFILSLVSTCNICDDDKKIYVALHYVTISIPAYPNKNCYGWSGNGCSKKFVSLESVTRKDTLTFTSS